MDEQQLNDLKNALTNAISSSISQGFSNMDMPKQDRNDRPKNNLPADTLGSTLQSLSGGAAIFGNLLNQINRNSMTIGELGDVVNDTGNVLGSALGSLGNKSNKLNKVLGPLGSVAKLFGGSIRIATGFIQENIDIFRTLTRVGGGLNGNLFELQTQSAQAGLSLRDFAQITMDNSQTFAMLGAGVNEGSKRFAELSQEFRQSNFIDELMALGMGFTEANEFLAENIKLNIRQSNLERLTQRDEKKQREDQLDRVRSLAKNFTILSKLTGQQTSQIQDDLIARQREGATIAALRLLEKDGVTGAQEGFNAAITGLKGAPTVLKDLVADLIQTGAPLTEATKNFMATNQEAGALADEIAQAVKRGASAQEIEQLAEQATAQTLQFADSRQGLILATFANISEVAKGQADILEQVDPIITSIQSKFNNTNDIAGSFLQLLTQITEETQKQMQAQTEGMGAVKLTTAVETTFADVAGALRTALMNAMSGIDDELIGIAQAINLGGEDFLSVTNDLTDKAQEFLQQNTTDIQKARLELIEKTKGEGNTLIDTVFTPLNATVGQMLDALEGNNEELLAKMLDNSGQFTTELDNFIKDTFKSRIKEPSSVGPTIQEINEQAVQSIENFNDTINKYINEMINSFNTNFFTPVKTKFTELGNEVNRIYENINNTIDEYKQKFNDFFIGPDGIFTKMQNMFNEIKTFFNTPFDDLFDFSSNVRAIEAEPKTQVQIADLQKIKLDDGGLKGSIDEFNNNFANLIANFNLQNNNVNNSTESISPDRVLSNNNQQSDVITEIKRQTVLLENQLNILEDGNRLAKNMRNQYRNDTNGMIVG